MTVLEIWPATGWYSEILAPITRPNGIYYAAGFAMTADRTPQWRKDMQIEYRKKLQAHPAIYDHVPDIGYMPVEYVVDLAESAGFSLEAQSEINANPKDTRDHPAGVWSLPPGYRLCGSMDEGAEREACTAKYRAIGESDRMTLRFSKPE